IAGSAHEPQILEARHGAPDEGASMGHRNAVVVRHCAPTPPQRSIRSPISLSKHARRCQLAAAVVYDRGGALRYSPRDGREILLPLDALRQKRSRSRWRGTLFHEIGIARSRSMGEIA